MWAIYRRKPAANTVPELGDHGAHAELLILTYVCRANESHVGQLSAVRPTTASSSALVLQLRDVTALFREYTYLTSQEQQKIQAEGGSNLSLLSSSSNASQLPMSNLALQNAFNATGINRTGSAIPFEDQDIVATLSFTQPPSEKEAATGKEEVYNVYRKAFVVLVVGKGQGLSTAVSSDAASKALDSMSATASLQLEPVEKAPSTISPSGETPLNFDDDVHDASMGTSARGIISGALGLSFAPSTESLVHSIAVTRNSIDADGRVMATAPRHLQLRQETSESLPTGTAPAPLASTSALDVLDFGDFNVNTCSYRDILLQANPERHQSHHHHHTQKSTANLSFTNSSTTVAISPFTPFTPSAFPTKEFLESASGSLAVSPVEDDHLICHAPLSNTVVEVTIGSVNNSDYIHGSLKMYLITSSVVGEAAATGAVPEMREEAVHYGDSIRIPPNTFARLRVIYNPKKNVSEMGSLAAIPLLGGNASKSTAAGRTNKRKKEQGRVAPSLTETLLHASGANEGNQGAAQVRSKVWGDRVIGGDRTKFTIVLLARTVTLESPHPSHPTLSRNFQQLLASSETHATDVAGRRRAALPLFPLLGSSATGYQAIMLPCRAYVHVPEVRVKPGHEIVSFGQCYVSQTCFAHLVLQNLAGTDAELALDLQSKAIAFISAEAFPLNDDHVAVLSANALAANQGPPPQKPTQVPLGIPIPLACLSEINRLFLQLTKEGPAPSQQLDGAGISSSTYLVIPARSEVSIKLTIVPQRVNPSYTKQLTVHNISALIDDRNPATFRAPSQDKFPGCLNLAGVVLSHPDAATGSLNSLVSRVLTKGLSTAVLETAAAMSHGVLPYSSASPWWQLFSPVSGVGTASHHQRFVVTIVSNNKESQDTRLHDTLYRCERRGVAYAEVDSKVALGDQGGGGSGAKAGMLSRRSSMSNLSSVPTFTPDRPGSGGGLKRKDTVLMSGTPYRNRHSDPQSNRTLSHAPTFSYPNAYKQPKVICNFPYAGESFRIKNKSMDKSLEVTISTTSHDITLMCLKGCLTASLVEQRQQVASAVPDTPEVPLNNNSFDAMTSLTQDGVRIFSQDNSIALDENAIAEALSATANTIPSTATSPINGMQRNASHDVDSPAERAVAAATPLGSSPIPQDVDCGMVSPARSWSRKERSLSFRGSPMSPRGTSDQIAQDPKVGATATRSVKITVVKGSNADPAVIEARNRLDDLCGLMASILNMDSAAQPISNDPNVGGKDSRGASEGGASTQGGVSNSVNDPNTNQHLSEDSADLGSEEGDSPLVSSDSQEGSSSGGTSDESDAAESEESVEKEPPSGGFSGGTSFTSKDSGESAKHLDQRSRRKLRASASKPPSQVVAQPPSQPVLRTVDEQTGLPHFLNPPSVARLLELKNELLLTVQNSLVPITTFAQEAASAHRTQPHPPAAPGLVVSPSGPTTSPQSTLAAYHVTISIPPRESFIFYAVIKRGASTSRWTTKEDSIAIHVSGVEQPQIIRLSYQLCESGFEVAHKSKSFGDVLKGETKSMAVKVENPNAAPTWFYIERLDDASLNAVKVEGTSLSTRGARFWGYLKPHSSREIEVSSNFPFLDKFEQVLRVRNVLVDTNVAEMTLKAMVKKGDLFDVAPESLTFGVTLSSKAPRSTAGGKVTLTNTSKHKREICLKLGGAATDLDSLLNTQPLLDLLSDDLRARLISRIGEGAQPFLTSMSLELADVGKRGTASKSMEERIETLERKLKIVVRKGKTEKIVLVRAQLNKLKAALTGVSEGDGGGGGTVSDFGGDSDSCVSDSADEGEGRNSINKAAKDSKLVYNEFRLAEVLSPKGGGISLPVLGAGEGLTIHIAVQARFAFTPQSREDRRLLYDVLAEWRSKAPESPPRQSANKDGSDNDEEDAKKVPIFERGATFHFSEVRDAESRREMAVNVQWFAVDEELLEEPSTPSSGVGLSPSSLSASPQAAQHTVHGLASKLLSRPHSLGSDSGGGYQGGSSPSAFTRSLSVDDDVPFLSKKAQLLAPVPSSVASSAPSTSTSKVSAVDAVFVLANGALSFEGKKPAVGVAFLARFPHPLPIVDPLSGVYFSPEVAPLPSNKATIRLVASTAAVTVLMLPNDATRVSSNDGVGFKNAKFKCSPSSLLVDVEAPSQVTLEVLPRSVGTQRYRLPIKNLNNPSDVCHIEVEFTAILNNKALRVSWDGYSGVPGEDEEAGADIPVMKFPKMVAPCLPNAIPVRTFNVQTLFPHPPSTSKGSSTSHRRYLSVSTNQPQHLIVSTNAEFSNVVAGTDLLSFPATSTTPLTLHVAFLPQALEVLPFLTTRTTAPSWQASCGVTVNLLDVQTDEKGAVLETSPNSLIASVMFEASLDISYGLLDIRSPAFLSASSGQSDVWSSTYTDGAVFTLKPSSDTFGGGYPGVERRQIDLGLVSATEPSRPAAPINSANQSPLSSSSTSFILQSSTASSLREFADQSGTKSTVFIINNLSDTEHLSFAVSSISLLQCQTAEISGPSDVSIFVMRDGTWRLHKAETAPKDKTPARTFTLGRRDDPTAAATSSSSSTILTLAPAEALPIRIAITPKASGYFSQLVTISNQTSAQEAIEVEIFGVRYERALLSSETNLTIASTFQPTFETATATPSVPRLPASQHKGEMHKSGSFDDDLDSTVFGGSQGFPCPVYHSSSDDFYHLAKAYSVTTILENRSGVPITLGLRCTDLPLSLEESLVPFATASSDLHPADPTWERHHRQYFGHLSLRPKEQKYVRLTLLGVPPYQRGSVEYKRLEALGKVHVRGKIYFDVLDAIPQKQRIWFLRHQPTSMVLKKGQVALMLSIETSFAVSEGVASPSVVDVGKIGALGRGSSSTAASAVATSDKRRINIVITNRSQAMPLEILRVPQQCVKLGGFRIVTSAVPSDEGSSPLYELPKDGRALSIPPGAVLQIEAMVTMEKEVTQGPFSREQCFINHNNNENILSVQIKGRYYASIWRIRFNDTDLKVLRNERESINLGSLRIDVKGRNSVNVDSSAISFQQQQGPVSVLVITDNRFSLACYEGRGITASVTCTDNESLEGLVAIQLTTRDTCEPIARQLLFKDESTSIKMRLRTLVVSPASYNPKGGVSWLSRLSSAFFGSRKPATGVAKVSVYYPLCRLCVNCECTPSNYPLPIGFVDTFEVFAGRGQAANSRDSWVGTLHVREDWIDRDEGEEEVPVYGSLQPFHTFQIDTLFAGPILSMELAQTASSDASVLAPKSEPPVLTQASVAAPINRIELAPLRMYSIAKEGQLGGEGGFVEQCVGVVYGASLTVSNIAAAHTVALEIQCLLRAEVRSSFESEFSEDTSGLFDEDAPFINLRILSSGSGGPYAPNTTSVLTPTAAVVANNSPDVPVMASGDGAFPSGAAGRVQLEPSGAPGASVVISLEVSMSKMLEEELLKTVEEDKGGNDSSIRLLIADANLTQPAGQRLLPIVLTRRFSSEDLTEFVLKENAARRRYRRKSVMSELGSAPDSPQPQPQDMTADMDDEEDEDVGVDGTQARPRGSDQPWLSLVEPGSACSAGEEGSSLTLTAEASGPDGQGGEYRDGDTYFVLDVTSVLPTAGSEFAPFHVLLRNLRGAAVKFDIRIVSTSPKRWLKLHTEEVHRPQVLQDSSSAHSASQHPSRRTVTVSDPSENRIRPHGDLKVQCIPLCSDVGTFEADLMITNASDTSEAIFLKICLHVFSGGQGGAGASAADNLPLPAVTDTPQDAPAIIAASNPLPPPLSLSGRGDSGDGSHLPSPGAMSASSNPNDFEPNSTIAEWGRAISAAGTPASQPSNPPTIEVTKPVPVAPLEQPQPPLAIGTTPHRLRGVPVTIYCPSRGGGGMTASDEFGVTPMDLRTFVGPFTLESRYFEIHNKASNALEFTVRAPGAIGSAKQKPPPSDTAAQPAVAANGAQPKTHVYPEEHTSLIGGSACIVSPDQVEAVITVPAQSKRTVQLFIGVSDVLLASGSKAEITADIVITSKMLRNTAFVVRVTCRVMPPSFAVVPSALLLDIQPNFPAARPSGSEPSSPASQSTITEAEFEDATLTWYRHMNPNDEALARMSGHLLELEADHTAELGPTLNQEVRVQNLASRPCQYVVMTDAKIFYVHSPVLAIEGMGIGILPLTVNMHELRKCMHELETSTIFGPTVRVSTVGGNAVFLFEERVYVYHRYEPRERQTIFLNIRVSRPGPSPTSTVPQLYYSYHCHLKSRLEARVFTVIRLFLVLFGSHRDELLREIERLDRGAQMSGLHHLYAGGLKRYRIKNHAQPLRNNNSHNATSDSSSHLDVPISRNNDAPSASMPSATPSPMRFSSMPYTNVGAAQPTNFSASSDEEVLMLGICFISSDLVHMMNHEGKVRCCHPLVQQTLVAYAQHAFSSLEPNTPSTPAEAKKALFSAALPLPSVDDPDRYFASWVLLIRMLTACIEHNDVIATFVSKDLWGCPEAPAPLLKHIAISLEKLKEALFHCEKAAVGRQ